jgi:hypothetical protein
VLASKQYCDTSEVVVPASYSRGHYFEILRDCPDRVFFLFFVSYFFWGGGGLTHSPVKAVDNNLHNERILSSISNLVLKTSFHTTGL